MIRAIILLLVSTEIFTLCSGYRILAIHADNGKSHFIMINGLLKGLARKGHQVDLINTFPVNEKIPNLTQIITLSEDSQETPTVVDLTFVRSFYRDLSVLPNIGYRLCKHLGDPRILDLINNPPKDPPYDIIILHFSSYQCYTAIGHIWNIPVVLIHTSALYPWRHVVIGNPENIAFSPNNMVAIPEGNTFWSRFLNTYWFYKFKFSILYHMKNQNKLLQKYFGPDFPSVHELERSAALVLVNTYFPVNGAKPMATNLIEIGGLHIQNDGPELSQDLKKWLDESADGVIYFSFGSNFRIEMFPNETVDIIFKALEQLAPMRVLIRISKPKELSFNIPENFYPLSWIPQEKVLQHPNLKLFVTHGGLLGTQESIFYGVPMLCMPLVADQFQNSMNYVSKKIAVMVDPMSLAREDFENALNKILADPIYVENIRKLSRIFRDRPQSAMDTAIFWVEFVARNGKESIRSPAMDLTWWQVALLDVYAVFITGILPIVFSVIFFSKIIWRVISRGKANIITKLKRN